VPVADFLHGHDALAAWTAEVAGRPAGHVCRVSAARAFRDAEVVNAICADALGCRPRLRAAAGDEGPDVQVMVLPGQGRSPTSSMTERRRPV
jgi:hypothetical protein